MNEKNWNQSVSFHHDLDPDYRAVQAWMWVPNCYQLIEQSLKLLLRRKNQGKSNGHRLSPLYSSLDNAHKGLLEQSYSGYFQLHPYLSESTLESFLKCADRGKKYKGKEHDGYTTWRYLLLEGFPLDENEAPLIDIGAMIEISFALCEIIQVEVMDNEVCSSIEPVIQRIERALSEIFHSLEFDSIGRKCPGLPEKSWQYYRDLMSRNLLWVRCYLKSSSRPELSQYHTAILEEICSELKSHHRYNFLQYINLLESGVVKLFDSPVS